MSLTAPPVDPRTATQLREDLQQQLSANVPEWSATDPVTGEPDQASAALIDIAARFAEIVVERLNQAPDKNFRAFLDLLGTTRLRRGRACRNSSSGSTGRRRERTGDFRNGARAHCGGGEFASARGSRCRARLVC
jgi:hypothetical protein